MWKKKLRKKKTRLESASLDLIEINMVKGFVR